MRVYLDTNILVFSLFQRDDLSSFVSNILIDYSNILLTSTVCVDELIHLCQIGKINYGGKRNSITATNIVSAIEESGIEIIPVSKKHLIKVASLPMYDNHKDPNDRLIIAQSISDGIALISSDQKFYLYESDGLELIFNKR